MSFPPAITFCGTDTGVGKTFVAAALLSELRRRELDVAPFKPLESGAAPDGPADADALRRAAGARHPLQLVCPWPLPLPVAPADELERLGIDVGRDDLLEAARQIGDGADLLIAETAGGAKSPLTPALTSLDLAAMLPGATVLVVRDSLGAISRASTAVDAATLAGHRIDLVVLNDLGDGGPGFDAHARSLARLHPGLRLCAASTAAPCPADLVALALELAGRGATTAVSTRTTT